MRRELCGPIPGTLNVVDGHPCWNRTLFPAGTRAKILRRRRTVITSGGAGTKHWRLVFHGPGKRFTEPLMRWTGTTDPLSGLELKFPTLESALRYAIKQGLDFSVEGVPALPTPRTSAPDEKAAPAVHQNCAA